MQLRQILCGILICSSYTTYGAASFTTTAKQAILYDVNSKTILFEHHAYDTMIPSSMTKIATAYELFKSLKSGQISMDSTFAVSANAWRKEGSSMFVRIDTQVPIRELIPGIIVSSGNDACITVAEGLSGNEEAFAQKMTATAKILGAKNTVFKNASGLPHPDHHSTAYDLVMISKGLYETFPDYYKQFFKQEVYTYNNITQYSHNSLLREKMGVDGFKTGHTEDGGYGLVFSAERYGTRLIGVVNGLESHSARTQAARQLLDWGQRQFETKKLFVKTIPAATMPVSGGTLETVPVSVAQDTYMSVVRGEELPKHAGVIITKSTAPLKAGEIVGKILLPASSIQPAREMPLVATQSVEKAGIIEVATQWVKTLLGQSPSKVPPQLPVQAKG